jgi:hypothetical protein
VKEKNVFQGIKMEGAYGERNKKFEGKIENA